MRKLIIFIMNFLLLNSLSYVLYAGGGSDISDYLKSKRTTKINYDMYLDLVNNKYTYKYNEPYNNYENAYIEYSLTLYSKMEPIYDNNNSIISFLASEDYQLVFRSRAKQSHILGQGSNPNDSYDYGTFGVNPPTITVNSKKLYLYGGNFFAMVNGDGDVDRMNTIKEVKREVIYTIPKNELATIHIEWGPHMEFKYSSYDSGTTTYSPGNAIYPKLISTNETGIFTGQNIDVTFTLANGYNGPTKPIITPSNTSDYTKNSITLTASNSIIPVNMPSVNISCYQYSINNTNTWTIGTSCTVSENCTVYFRAVDSIGYTSEAKSKTVNTIDKSPPYIQFNPEPTGVINNSGIYTIPTANKVDFKVQAVDVGVSGINSFSGEGTNIGSNTKHIEIDDAPDGKTFNEYEWIFSATDKAGNTSTSFKVKQLILFEGPSINYSLPKDIYNNWYKNGTMSGLEETKDASRRIRKDHPTLISLYYKDNNDDQYESVTGNTLTFDEGKHTITLKAVDEACNVTLKEGIQFNIDYTPPSLDMKINDSPWTGDEKNPFYINNVDDIKDFIITDKASGSGFDSLTYTSPSPNTIPSVKVNTISIEPESTYQDITHRFTPDETEYNYVFTLQDVAENVTSKTLWLLYDKTPIDRNDITFRLDDKNGQTSIETNNTTGNFSNLSVIVKKQAAGTAQPISYTWTLDGIPQNPGIFNLSGDEYIGQLLSSNIAEGTHEVVITVLDQAGNTSTDEFMFTMDSISPVIQKEWIKISNDGGDTTSFEINPKVSEGDETDIAVYQATSKDDIDNGIAIKLWDSESQDEKGSFTLQNGIGTISLMAVDQAGNIAGPAKYTVVRPITPEAPELVKRIADDYESFSIKVHNSPSAPMIGGVQYALHYKGVGVEEDGETPIAGSVVQAADKTNHTWSASALGSGGAKACEASLLRKFRVYGVLEPTGTIAPNIIALMKQGEAIVYAIPNSPPVFVEGTDWPDYLGLVPSLSLPNVKDPDKHSIYYRFVTVTDGTTTIWETDEPGQLPDVNWSSQLAQGGRVYLQTWAGQDEPWAHDIAEIYKDYDASHVDLKAPSPGIAKTLWGAVPRWTNESSFEMLISDEGNNDWYSGIKGIEVSLIPWILNEGNEGEDLSSGREAYTTVPADYSLGANTANIHLTIPSSLSGLYRLMVTTSDRANNSTTSYAGFALLDYSKPTVTHSITRPYESTYGSFIADPLGTISARLQAYDELSGPSKWGYQAEGKPWIWSYWKDEEVVLTPDWTSVKKQRIRFTLQDKAGNQSTVTSWAQVYYDPTPPEFELELTGLTGLENSYVSNLNTLNATLEPTSADSKWNLIRILDNGDELVYETRTSWSSIKNDPNLWEDGARYKVKASVPNINGIYGTRETSVFILDRTQATPIQLSLLPPTDRTRQSYYQQEPFIVSWQGGADSHTPVTRTLRLYQSAGGITKELQTLHIDTGVTQARINWGDTAIDWKAGGFFIQGTSINAAGLSITSSSVPIPVSGTGIGVFLPPYNGGTGSLAASWYFEDSDTTIDYRYRLWIQDQIDHSLSAELETTERSILIDLSPYTIEDGEKLYLTVDAYDGEGTILGSGSSPISVADKGTPKITWEFLPQAVSSDKILARFKVTPSVSGLGGATWLIEKKNSDGNWAILPNENGSEWREAADPAGSDIGGDFSEHVTTGDVVRLTVMVENSVARASQISSGALLVDDSAPPAPVVLDQGAVINPTKQALSFNWELTETDTESGLDSYYYGWFYKGFTDTPEVWIKMTGNEQKASIDLSGRPLQELDGKTVTIAVKAVNGAGISSIGYSDGILLDSTAPIIDGIRLYAEETRNTELSGYIKPGIVQGKKLYITIDAIDEESWIHGGTAQAYRFDKDHSTWMTVGDAIPVVGTNAVFTLPEEYTGFNNGDIWRVEGYAEDAAGNRSACAMSDGFMIEAGIPYVLDLEAFLDATRINLNWALSSSGEDRWVNQYAITVAAKNTTTTYTTSRKTMSFQWGTDGLGLINGDTVQFSVAAFSYAGNSSNSSDTSDYSLTLTIDSNPPQIDTMATRVPMTAKSTHWYDCIDGHIEYDADRGVSGIQWSAALVPGELPLIAWQDKRWISAWDFRKELSEITPDLLSAWDKKQIRLSFRAANTMGIWSEASTMKAITIDTTHPETVILTRPSAYSNETTSVTGWTLKLQDAQSGIMGYMAALVPSASVSGTNTPESYIWPDTAAYNEMADPSPETLSELPIAIPLTKGSEGAFIPLVRVRNGTGNWTLSAGSPITMDRTSPKILSLLWPGAVKQELNLDGNNRTVEVCNGPEQVMEVVADEEVKWTLTGPWFETQQGPPEGYRDDLSTSLNFGTNPDGTLYPTTLTLEDQAGNQAVFGSILRYNRAPVVSLNEKALTVRPGVPIRLSDLVSITDDEDNRLGDYPLNFLWEPGNGNDDLAWVGGSINSTLFGNPEAYTTTYLHSSEKAQISWYPGTLNVTDRYGKTSTLELPMVVENTRSGTLAVNEYWTGPFEIHGQVIVPSGLNLTLEGSAVTVNAGLQNGIMNGGITIEEGGIAIVKNSTLGSAVFGTLWKGIQVQGYLDILDTTIKEAERGISLLKGTYIQLENIAFQQNRIGLHVHGSSTLVKNCLFDRNLLYAIKEDSGAAVHVVDNRFIQNAFDYYHEEETVVDMDRINSIAGNSGNVSE